MPLIKSSNIIARKIGDEYVLVPLRSSTAELGAVYSLNSVGFFIWELLDDPHSVIELRDSVFQEFDVSLETAEADVSGFVKELVEIGALEEI